MARRFKVLKLPSWNQVSVLLDATPVILPAIIAAFGSVSIVLLLLGQMQSVLVWPLGLLAAAIVTWLILKYYKPHGPGTRKERLAANLFVLVGVVVWIGFNILYTAQHVITNRDPGVYTITATWLTQRDNLQLTASNAFEGVSGIDPISGGFALAPGHDDQLAAQGAHLLPALLGLAGRIVGDMDMLRLNVIFGGIALLAVYAFARQHVRPQWATVATAILALSMPLIYFSRDMYTEPLALLLTFGALALIGLAWHTNKAWLWLVAGLVAGAGTLTRIDAYITVAGLCVFAVANLAISARKDRRQALISMGLLLCGMAVTSLLGLLDIMHLSTPYFLSEWVNIRPELLLIGIILVAGAAMIALCWKTPVLKYVDSATRRWRGPAAAILVVALIVVLATRPLWYVGYGYNKDASQRSYAELSVNWLVWYLGLTIVVAGGIGFALAAWRVIKQHTVLLAAVIVVGGTALLYLVMPSIAPDQIWASRRFLPVVLPGLIVFGVYALDRLSLLKKIGRVGVPGKTTATVIATFAVLGPLTVTTPLFYAREYTLYATVEAICQAVPKDAAVLWVGMARSQLIEPTKAMCGVPAEGYGQLFRADDKPSATLLSQAAKAARQNGYQPVVGVYERDLQLLDYPDATPTYEFGYARLEHVRTRPPKKAIEIKGAIILGELQKDGSIKPLR